MGYHPQPGFSGKTSVKQKRGRSMKYGFEFFDQYVERRNTRCVKWDACNERFGVGTDVELLPMWIADMDFRSPDEVVEAVVQRAELGLYPYISAGDSFAAAAADWVCRRYHWHTEKDEIVFTPGVIPGFNAAYQHFSQPGDGIIMQTPVYYPFMDSIISNGRRVVNCPMLEKDGQWSMDFAAIEQAVQEPSNRILIMSNPQNPTGRCFSREELERLGTLCADNDVLLICDEIHADLIMNGASFCSMGTLSEKVRQNAIFHYAPSKTFNLASLQTSYAVVPNEAIRAGLQAGLAANRIVNMNWFGPAAMEAAYGKCEEYVDGLCAYVSANMEYMERYLHDHLPQLRMQKSEGTYMVWVDFRGTGMSTEEIESFIIHRAHIAVDMGSWFGKGGEGFLRFNLACPRMLVERAMRQLSEAFAAL